MSAESLVNLREVRRALQETRGRRKLDLILSAPDPQALVAALPEEELYFAVLDIGPDDAAPLIALATPQQFRHFIDMSAWPRADEGPRTTEIARWLQLAREGEDEVRFREQVEGLDQELISLMLRREIEVHELTEDHQPEPKQPGMAFYTPDRRYLLEFSGGAGYAELKRLVDELYARDPFGASRLMESIRWDVPTELEESARRWRDGRLRDLGVPQFDEAVSFYARATAQPLGGAGGAGEQALTAPARPLLDVALERLEGDALERAEEGLVYAANAALVANRTPLDDAEEVRDQLAGARATLSLGLEVLSGGDPDAAGQILGGRHVREIFQAGLAHGYRLQTRARKLAAAARLPQAKTVTLLDAPLDAVVDALLGARPLFHEPGQRRPRAFASRADLLRADALLDEVEATLALLGRLGLSPAALGPLAEAAGIAPTALKASGAVRSLAESRLSGKPLSLAGLSEEPRERSPEIARMVAELLPAGGTDAEERAAARLRASV